MTSTSMLFDEVSEEPEFSSHLQGSQRSKNLQSTQNLFDSVEQEYEPSKATQALFDSLEEKPSSFVENAKDLFTPKPRESDPNKSIRQNILDMYRPEEKTPEQLKAMSIEEKLAYNQEIENLRRLQQLLELARDMSGLTLSASEHIPGLKPDEDDLMVGLGETVGSFLPISKLYNFIGKPLVSFASKSPIARKGLEALARMTGFGLTGATHEAARELVQGEDTEYRRTGQRRGKMGGDRCVTASFGIRCGL